MDLNAVPGVSWYKYIYTPREPVKRHPPLSYITLTLCAHAIKGPQWQSRNNQASAWQLCHTLPTENLLEDADGRMLLLLLLPLLLVLLIAQLTLLLLVLLMMLLTCALLSAAIAFNVPQGGLTISRSFFRSHCFRR